MKSQSWSIRGGALLALAVSLWCAPAIRADNLDRKLLRAPRLVETLRQKGIHNVGFLRYRVQLGDKAENFQTAALNGNLPVRLENALIIHLGSETDLGIIHDASKVASRAGVGEWFTIPVERRKLFAVEYPLAWGQRKVKADAFVTGLVRVPADYSRVRVILEVFTAREPARMIHLADFSLQSDTQLLHDLGKSYSVSRKLPPQKGKRSGAFIRDLVFESIRNEKLNPNPEPPLPDRTSVLVGDKVEFDLLVDEQSAAIKPTNEIECPDPDRKVVFRLTNKSSERVAVDVKLNGESLLFKSKEPAETCRIWVLEAGKSYSLQGYYTEDTEQNVLPFKMVAGEAEAQARKELGDRAGEIQITVFTESDETMPVSPTLRDLPGQLDRQARKDFRTLQNALLGRAQLMRKTHTIVEGGRPVIRDLIVADPDAENKETAKLNTVEFKRNTQSPASIILKLIPKGVATSGVP